MRRAALICATLLLCASAVSAQEERRPRSAWMAVPTAEDLRKAYPADAAARLIGGRVLLACDLTVEGRLDHCSVMAESPTGWGFGEAAVSLSSKFRVEPKLRDGRAVEGGRIRFPIVFSLRNQATKT